MFRRPNGRPAWCCCPSRPVRLEYLRAARIRVASRFSGRVWVLESYLDFWVALWSGLRRTRGGWLTGVAVTGVADPVVRVLRGNGSIWRSLPDCCGGGGRPGWCPGVRICAGARAFPGCVHLVVLRRARALGSGGRWVSAAAVSPVGVQGADVAGFGLGEAFFGEGDRPLPGVYGAMVLTAREGQI